MVTVYLWRGVYGHAAMQIDTPYRREYISFYPTKSSNQKRKPDRVAKIVDGMGFYEIFGGVPAYVYPSFEVEIKEEDKPEPERIELFNLNESAIFDYWDEIRNNSTKYHLLFSNCSNVVGQGLLAGWVGTFPEYDGALDQNQLRKIGEDLKKRIERNYKRNRNEVRPSAFTNIKEDSHMLFTVATGVLAFASVLTGSAALALVTLWTALARTGFEEGLKFIWDPRTVSELASYLEAKIG